MRILLTGGTGRLAQHLLSRPLSGRFEWRILSRRPSTGSRDWSIGNLATGAGLDRALDNVEAIMHLASDPLHPEQDVFAAQHLVQAAGAAGVKHLLYLSIIGVDRIPYSYYQAKFRAEQIIAGGRTPWTILRAAQFHSFIDWLLQRAMRWPGLILVPAGYFVQSVADEEVADRLITAVIQGPSWRMADFAGPEVLRASEAARIWKRARSPGRLVVPVPLFGAVPRAFMTGANTAPDGERGRMTWKEWVERPALRSEHVAAHGSLKTDHP